MWTAHALVSEARPFAADIWRVVESQSQVATMQLVDTLDEQAALEAELDRSKPPLPPERAGLDYLLAAPFRYAPYPHGSRFRRARQREGCFYASEQVETAIAESAFYHLLFFLASPGTPLPRNPQERTAFQLPVCTGRAIDLTVTPFSRDRATWMDPVAYAACQNLADIARAAEIGVIRYESVRDPGGRANLALLTPAAFGAPAPTARQTWHILLRHDRADAIGEMPRSALSFAYAAWSAVDPRLALGVGSGLGGRTK